MVFHSSLDYVFEAKRDSNQSSAVLPTGIMFPQKNVNGQDDTMSDIRDVVHFGLHHFNHPLFQAAHLARQRESSTSPGSSAVIHSDILVEIDPIQQVLDEYNDEDNRDHPHRLSSTIKIGEFVETVCSFYGVPGFYTKTEGLLVYDVYAIAKICGRYANKAETRRAVDKIFSDSDSTLDAGSSTFVIEGKSMLANF